MIQSAFMNIAGFLMHLFIIPFVLFFLFLDGKTFTEKIRNALPFDRADEKKAMNELVKITDTIIIYTFLIGVAEGIYGGDAFFHSRDRLPFLLGHNYGHSVYDTYSGREYDNSSRGDNTAVFGQLCYGHHSSRPGMRGYRDKSEYRQTEDSGGQKRPSSGRYACSHYRRDFWLSEWSASS
jgi:hypothetical protein